MYIKTGIWLKTESHSASTGAGFSKNLKSSSDLKHEKTVVAKVISELKSVSGLKKTFPETGRRYITNRMFE